MAGHTTKGELVSANNIHIDDGVLFVKTYEEGLFTGFAQEPNSYRQDTMDWVTVPSGTNYPRGAGAKCARVHHTTSGKTYYGHERRADFKTHLGITSYTPAAGLPAAVSGYPTELRYGAWLYVANNFDFTSSTKYHIGMAGVRNPSTLTIGGTTNNWPGGGINREYGFSFRLLPSIPSGTQAVWKTYEYFANRFGSNGTSGASARLSTPSGGDLYVQMGAWIYFEIRLKVNQNKAVADGILEIRCKRPYAGDSNSYLAYQRTDLQFHPTHSTESGGRMFVPITGIHVPCAFLGGSQKTPRTNYPNNGDSGTRYSYLGEWVVDDEAIHISVASDTFAGGTGGSSPPPDPNPPASTSIIGDDDTGGSPSLSNNTSDRARGSGPWAVPNDSTLLQLMSFNWTGDGLGTGAGASQQWQGVVHADATGQPGEVLAATAVGTVSDNAALGIQTLPLNAVIDTTVHETVHLYLWTGESSAVSRYQNLPDSGSTTFRVYTVNFAGGPTSLHGQNATTTNTNLPEMWVETTPFVSEPEPIPEVIVPRPSGGVYGNRYTRTGSGGTRGPRRTA